MSLLLLKEFAGKINVAQADSLILELSFVMVFGIVRRFILCVLGLSLAGIRLFGFFCVN